MRPLRVFLIVLAVGILYGSQASLVFAQSDLDSLLQRLQQATNASPAEFAGDASRLLSEAQGLSDSQKQRFDSELNVAASVKLSAPESATLPSEQLSFLIEHGYAGLAGESKQTIDEKLLSDAALTAGLSDAAFSVFASQAGDSLSEEKRDQLLAATMASAGKTDSLGFESMHQLVEQRLAHLYSDDESGRVARRSVVVDWARKHPPASLSFEQADWVMRQLLPAWMNENRPASIRARWEADIVAPRSGEYEFSLAPEDLVATRDYGESKNFKLDYRLMVNGKSLKRNSEEPGSFRVVGLSAGIPVRLVFELDYDLKGYVALPATGQLYWSGPGVNKQLVGGNVVRLPGSAQGGVRLSIDRTDSDGTHSCSTEVDRIDQILGKHPICTHERLLEEFSSKCIDHFLSQDVLSSAVTKATSDDPSERASHPLMVMPDYRGILNKCSSEKRKQIARVLASQPELFGPLDVWTMIYFHDALRFGAQREAADFLGTWLSVHGNEAPEFVSTPNDYWEVNLKPFRHLTIPLAIEHAESAKWLESDYLLDENGMCNPAVAKVLAYVHLVNGQLLKWIKRLDEQLAQPDCQGDVRVGWLIARATAEEMRGCPGNHEHYPGCHSIGAGLGWLDEAQLVAKSDAVKDQASAELAARLVALGKLERAREVLSDRESLAPWLAKLDEAEAKQVEKAKADTLAANAAVIAEMKRRQQRASSKGNSQAASRYSSIIQSLEDGS